MRCDLYKLTDKNGVTRLLWVIPGRDKLTRRQQSDGSMKEPAVPGQTPKTHSIHTITDFTGWQVGKPMADSLFKPPAGVKFQEAGQGIATPGLPHGR